MVKQWVGPGEDAYRVEDANGVMVTIPAHDIINDHVDARQPITVDSIPPLYITSS